MKLTAKQNSIIYCLQNGWVLITERDANFVSCCSHTLQFNFSLTIFWNLVKKDLIYQGNIQDRFDWLLTEKGKNIKTKPVEF